jgi:hypothetical protein
MSVGSIIQGAGGPKSQTPPPPPPPKSPLEPAGDIKGG